MYINSVVSYLGAWGNLERTRNHIIADLNRCLRSIDRAGLEEPKNESDLVGRENRPIIRAKRLPPRPQSEGRPIVEGRGPLSPLLVHKAIGNGLLQLGWQPGVRLGRTNPPHIRIESIDFVKDGVGIEIEMGKASLVESHIFARFPRFVQANIIQSAVALVPMKSLSRQMTAGLWPFEWLKDGLQEMRPWPLKYKLTVIGFSMSETSIEVIEATSELDRFLIDAIGMSVEEMVLMNERLDYDFKVRLPTPEKLAQEVCGFANLRGGGHILLGIDNGGRLVGLPRGEGLDDIRLRMTNVICDCCSPKPMFEFFTFDNPEDATTAILIMRVHEAERKPCMVQHRVYVRSGPSVRPADADEIRRLVLG